MKTMKWGIGVAAIFAALMVVGCLKRDFDELKSMPIHDKQTDTIDRYTLGLHFNRGKTHNWQNTEVPNDINIILLDSAYKKVDYFYFLKFNNWFKKVKFENGIMPINQNETLDCDNFAMLYKSLFGVAGYASKNQKEFAVAAVVVKQMNEFGGIPAAQGLHMVNLIFTNKNWYIFEPQTGKLIELHKYPNQKYIKYIIL